MESSISGYRIRISLQNPTNSGLSNLGPNYCLLHWGEIQWTQVEELQLDLALLANPAQSVALKQCAEHGVWGRQITDVIVNCRSNNDLCLLYPVYKSNSVVSSLSLFVCYGIKT